MKKFEAYNPHMEINNEIKDFLSQYPYLQYNIKDLEDGVELSFGKGIGVKYIKNLLDPYKINLTSKDPIIIKVTGKKNVDRFDDYKGKIIIGNIETINIPKLGIKDLPIKIDSGATTSSLHVEYLKKDNQKNTVTFIPLDDRFDQYNKRTYTMPMEAQIRVQSSNGDNEGRPMIKLDIELKGKTIKTYFTLADRKELEYPILIGKDILSGNFLVDAAQINK